jgi:ribonuclease BN (tRNA processing enzyme)
LKLHVLGCHGGELPRCRTTCFLVDDVLALDAGALTATLPLEKLIEIEDIVLTHSHFDHVKDLPLLADLVVGRRDKPITIWGSRECVNTLRANMFNDALWPDFTRIPSKRQPVLKLKSFRAGATVKIGKYMVRTVPVSHPVESVGMVVSNGKSALGISGDTGPTEKLWKLFNAAPNLRAVLVETSFPNDLQELANVSGHLTPRTLQTELKKFSRNGTQVFLYHLKPAYVAQLKREVNGMNVRVLELGETFEL